MTATIRVDIWDKLLRNLSTSPICAWTGEPIAVLGTHFNHPTVGRILRHGDAWRFVVPAWKSARHVKKVQIVVSGRRSYGFHPEVRVCETTWECSLILSRIARAAANVRRAVRPEDIAALKPWARFWNLWVSVEFLRGFLQTAAHAVFMPKSRDEVNLLLNVFLLEKGVYELNYELNNRPDWVNVPITGILEILQANKS